MMPRQAILALALALGAAGFQQPVPTARKTCAAPRQARGRILDELAELELPGPADPARAPERLDGLLDFLERGFGGGTDVISPLRRAVALLRGRPAFADADVLLMSDGELMDPPVDAATAACRLERTSDKPWLVLDTVDHMDGLERLVVVCVGLDAKIDDGSAVVARRSLPVSSDGRGSFRRARFARNREVIRRAR